MIIVLLTYKVPIEMIDSHRAAHVAWLREALEAGTLLAAGRQVPLTGGMLLVRGDLAAAQAWTANDPFAIHDLADYSFTEAAVSLTAPGLEALAG